MDIPTFCEHYYLISGLPLQCYDNKHSLQYSIPETPWKLVPLISNMSNIPGVPDIYYDSSAFDAFYGLVNIRAEACSLIIGPVKEQRYTLETLQRLHHALDIPATLYEQADHFFQSLPRGSLQLLIHHLNFINFVLNGEPGTSALEIINNYPASAVLRCDEEEDFYWRDDSVSQSYMYGLGKQMQEYIRQGDTDGLKDFMAHSKQSHMGKVANDELRQAKNIFLHTVSLSLQAAIEGGLSPEIAYSISDLYSQQMEKMDNIAEIMALNQQVRIEYSKRVAMYKYPSDSDQLLRRIINYVRTNTDQSITTTQVAEHVGYSRSYISSIFKNRLGFGLKKFILRTKLERSRVMLLYSTKSINEISMCLCFSSQSHFQKAFREQYGVTPQYYRKNGFNDNQ